jgi:hypothetical protein
MNIGGASPTTRAPKKKKKKNKKSFKMINKVAL